jgi:hypothetical protein
MIEDDEPVLVDDDTPDPEDSDIEPAKTPEGEPDIS